MISVLITGWSGLLGFHARSALLAVNCGLNFLEKEDKYSIVLAPRLTESNGIILSDLVRNADLILHFAGINRAAPEEVEKGNIDIARVLKAALISSGSKAHVIYANSTHSGSDTPYGRGKKSAHNTLFSWSQKYKNKYTNVVLPHIFGEGGRPFYNTVTATLCQQIVDGELPSINDGATVELLHAGTAIDAMINAFECEQTGTIRLQGMHLSVVDLHSMINGFKNQYDANQFPDLSSKFKEKLFNTYRWFEYPHSFPRTLKLHNDSRGVLFEAAKGGGGGQAFLSWTNAGIERGNHFHRNKVERFLVVSGQAEIKIRKLFSDKIEIFKVSGDNPQAVDMPTLHTHSIVNTGKEPLLTMFWSHEVFDPENPDTFAHTVDSGFNL